jgi:hypothetical protein
MQSHLCIGGNHDGLNYPAHADAETIQLAVGDHEMKPSHSSPYSPYTKETFDPMAEYGAP